MSLNAQAIAVSGYGYGAQLMAVSGYGSVVALEDVATGGSGYPVYGKYVRPKGIGEFLDVAMSEIYEAGTQEDVPIETRKQFAKVVKPYAKGKAKIPEVDKVDWKALEADVAKVEQLLVLWQTVLDDEELILMAYLEYYH